MNRFRAASERGKLIQEDLNNLLPGLLQHKGNIWLSYEPGLIPFVVQRVLVMAAYEQTAQHLDQVLGLQYRLFQEDPPQWSVVLKDDSNGFEFTHIFQYWAQFVERMHTLNLHGEVPRGIFNASFPGRKLLGDEYTASIKYLKYLSRQQPAPNYC